MHSTPTSEQPTGRRIGVFGGTFDPPHVGHVLTGQRVMAARSLDQVLFVVANDPWQKTGTRYVSPAAIRFQMVEQACYWSRLVQNRLSPSEIEISAGGPSYTSDTLRQLAREVPDAHFEVIVGSDTASQLDTWHESEWLADNATFVVVHRGGHKVRPSDGFAVEIVDLPLLEISSSEIRQRVAEGLSIDHLCPAPVVSLIAAHGLYSDRVAV